MSQCDQPSRCHDPVHPPAPRGLRCASSSSSVSAGYAVARAVRAAPIERVHLGVYKLAGATLDFLGTALGLQLLAGHTAFLSGPTAGALYGLRNMPTSADRGLGAGVAPAATSRALTTLVRTTWDLEGRDVADRADGIRVATPLRTLFDLARCFNQHRFERAAEDVWHKGLVTPERSRRVPGRGPPPRPRGRHGAWRTWLDPGGRAASPGAERPRARHHRHDRAGRLADAGPPAPADAAVRRGRSTSTSPGRRSAWPSSRATRGGTAATSRQRADQTRDRACALVGWLVHRYDEDAVVDPPRPAREILALYRRRAADLGRSPGILLRSAQQTEL